MEKDRDFKDRHFAMGRAEEDAPYGHDRENKVAFPPIFFLPLVASRFDRFFPTTQIDDCLYIPPESDITPRRTTGQATLKIRLYARCFGG